MKFEFEEHCGAESLELYALGALDEAKTEILEEHILICEGCRKRLDEADRYARAMKAGAARIRLEEAEKAEKVAARPFGWLGVPSLRWASALAAVCGVAALGSFSFVGTSGNQAMVKVGLEADRGLSSSISAPARHLLDLELDARGLQLGMDARTEIVDARGRVVEKGTASQAGQAVEVRTRRGFDAGAYFVRVYAANATEPAREFALKVK